MKERMNYSLFFYTKNYIVFQLHRREIDTINISLTFALLMQAKRIISFVLLCVFSLYIIPKEIYHAFVTHIDTEHVASHIKNHAEFSAEHHHCELMKVDQQFASFDVSIPYYEFSKPGYFKKQNEIAVSAFTISSFAYSSKQLRAPPVV